MYLRELIDKNFIEYASYVIKDRAIPHVDDGLKPVQRRILHSLREMDDGKFHKVANVIGHTMKYHPHGDASIGAALVNLANKEFFIDKQGNFGNILTGDASSAARYIECRLTPLAREVLFNPDLTNFVDSYDGRNKEPITLPAKVPALLMMGTEGIAVGLSTKILPHNFCELLESQIKILKGKPVELVPDFQQGCLVDAREYAGGNGKVRIRARIEIGSNKSLIIREVPYSVTTESLIASIEDAARKGRIKISQVNDFTTDKVEIEVTPSRGISAEELEPALYAFTDCEVSISTNLVLIKEEQPCQMTVTEVLSHNTAKLKADLEKELQIDLGRLQEAEYRKTLVQIFIENRVYKLIEDKKTSKAVNKAVHDGLAPFREQIKRDVTDDDVEKLLEIPIKRISRFDIDRNQAELREIRKRMRQVRAELEDTTAYTVKYLKGLLEKYGKSYPRRTRIKTFDTVDARDVAISNVKVRYDEKTGYLGTEIKSGRLFNLSPYDKFLIFKKDGSYSITAIPKKAFVGEGSPYLDLFNKDVLFNLIYRDKKSGLSYVKRFRIEKFILDKEYRLFDEGGSIQALSQAEQFRVKLSYKKKPKLKILSEEMDFSSLAIKTPGVKGNRVSTKEISRVKVFW